MKDKRKRKPSPSLDWRRIVIRLLLIIAGLLGVLASCLVLFVLYFMLFWESDSERWQRRHGIDPDQHIPLERYQQFPQAEIEFQKYTSELQAVLAGAEIIQIIDDDLIIDKFWLSHCIKGWFHALIGTDIRFESVIEAYENWAADSGWHHVAQLDATATPVDDAQEDPVNRYGETHEIHYRQMRLRLLWEHEDGEPSEYGHPVYATYFHLGLKYTYNECRPLLW